MYRKTLAVIGVGNMAKAIISGMLSSDSFDLDKLYLFDINRDQYSSLLSDRVTACESVNDAVASADAVLISVKPQNYSEILAQISSVKGFEAKLYISIGAGISTDSIRQSLGEVDVVRVLPNLPMVIGEGVSAICRNENIDRADFELVKRMFSCAGSVIEIDEAEMNRIIGVTSSSPAYVFKFISAICQGAEKQGIASDDLLATVCDMVIGSARMLKNSGVSPEELISRVASKGGTTERALLTLDKYNFDDIIAQAMIACTARADELGKQK